LAPIKKPRRLLSRTAGPEQRRGRNKLPEGNYEKKMKNRFVKTEMKMLVPPMMISILTSVSRVRQKNKSLNWKAEIKAP
jgi:hypothetical protein